MRLLDEPWRWCQRHVEMLEFGAGQHVRATSRYQVEFPDEFIGPFLRGWAPSCVRTLIPLTTRPREPLLNLTIRGPNGTSAALLTRSSIAALQAKYLEQLALTSPGQRLYFRLPDRLLEAICVFTPAVARQWAVDEPEGLAEYLRAGTDLNVRDRHVRTWQSLLGPAAQVLPDVLEEEPDPFSSSEHMLLAVPRLDPLPTCISDIDLLVRDYARAVQAAARARDHAFLVVLGEYGRRWEMIVETEIPLGRPSTVSVAEDRRLGEEGGGWFTQQVNTADARSFHLEARTSDHSIQIKDFRMVDNAGRMFGIPLLEAVRHTPESLALYSADRDRPTSGSLRLRLGPVTDVLTTTWLLIVLVMLAIMAAALAPSNRHTLTVMQIVTLPTTFAVALMLVREGSPLATRLLRRSRAMLGGLTVGLWLIAIWRVLNGPWWL